MTYLLNTVIIVFLMWILFAFGSALFAGLTTILAKCGIRKTDSDAATAIRTVIVLHSEKSALTASSPISEPPSVPGSCLLWRGASWICYYKALQGGLASVVVPIDKLSILVSIGFSALVFKERLSKKSALGLVLIVAGTLIMLI